MMLEPNQLSYSHSTACNLEKLGMGRGTKLVMYKLKFCNNVILVAMLIESIILLSLIH